MEWELAHVGDPAEGYAAWACVREWRFGKDRMLLHTRRSWC